MNEEYSSIRLMNPIKMEQFDFINKTLTRIAEKSGGCVIDEEGEPFSERCSVYAEVRKTTITGEDLEDFKKALRIADTFIVVLADEQSVVISMSVFCVWQELIDMDE